MYSTTYTESLDTFYSELRRFLLIKPPSSNVEKPCTKERQAELWEVFKMSHQRHRTLEMRKYRITSE